MSRLGSLTITVAAALIVLSAGGCKKKKSYQPSGNKPAFRVHNFSPGSPDVYITLDGWQNTGNAIGYTQYGPFGEYPYDNDGTQELKVYSPVSNASFLNATVNMQDYYTYAIFTADLFTQMDYLIVPVFNDHSSDASKCRVRVINLCPNAGPVTVIAGTDTICKDVDYLRAGDYTEIEGSEKMTQVFSADGQYLLSDRNHFYNGLQVKDIVISGYLNAADTNFAAKLTIVQE